MASKKSTNQKNSANKIIPIVVYKVPLFFWFDLFLEARAEILTYIRWVFGRFEGTKRTFRN